MIISPSFGAESSLCFVRRLLRVRLTMLVVLLVAAPCLAEETSEALNEAWRICNDHRWDECRQQFETLAVDEQWHLYSVYMPVFRQQYALERVMKGDPDSEEKIAAVDSLIREMMFATAHHGHLRAQMDVARHYRYVQKDFDEALRWLERVATADNVPEDMQLTPVFARDEIDQIRYQKSRAYFDATVIGIFIAAFLLFAVFGRASHGWDRVARVVATLPVTLNLFVYLAASHAQVIPIPELYLPGISPTMFHGFTLASIIGYGLLIRFSPSRRFMWVSLGLFLLQIGAVYILALVLSGLASQGAGQ